MMMPIFVFTRLHHGLAVAERALDPTSTNVLIVCSVVRTRAEVALRRLRLVTCSASVAPDVQRRHAGSITKHHLAGACVSTGCALKFANSRPVFDQASLASPLLFSLAVALRSLGYRKTRLFPEDSEFNCRCK